MGYSLPKTKIYNAVLDNYKDKYDVPVVAHIKGETVTPADIISVYERFRSFILDNEISASARFVIITKRETAAAILTITILDYAVLVPLDLEMTDKEYQFYIRLLDVDYILTDNDSRGIIAFASELGAGVIKFSTGGSYKDMGFRMQSGRDKGHVSEKKKNPENVMIKTTSGTTSIPKIVPVSAEAYDISFKTAASFFEYSSHDNFLILTRIFKGFAIYVFLRALYLGGTVVMASGFNYADLHKIINEYKITTFNATPAMLSSFAVFAEDNKLDFGQTQLRFIRATGAPLTRTLKEHLEEVFNTPIEQSYGMTEVLGISSTYKAPKGYKEGSAGIPTFLDIKTEDDEILVRGDTVFSGYENPEINNDEYFTDGWFRTGDMGYVDEDGYIFITGRIKELINRGGEKVSPYEVEAAVVKAGMANEAAVFPYPNSHGQEDIGIAVVPVPGKTYGIKELRSSLKDRLHSYKLPSLLYFMNEIPRSPDGKVQRNLLYEQLSGKHEAIRYISDDKSDRLSETEREILRIWKKGLKTRSIGLNDEFTDIGGDSLSGTMILAGIERRFETRIPVEMLFDGGTIKTIADFIDSADKAKNKFRFLVPVKISGSKKPLICVHSGTGDAVTYRHIGRYMDEDRPVYALRFDIKGEDWPKPLSFEYLSRIYADEIRRFDPEGPYNLCGHCWGGVLAFSIASELKKTGCRVNMIAMIDSAPRRTKTKKNNESNKGHLALNRVVGRSLRGLKRLSPSEKIMYLIRKASSFSNLMKLKYAARIHAHGLRRNKNLFIRIAGKTGMLVYAYERYNPKFYDGTVVYFKSTVDAGHSMEFPEYWKGFAAELKQVKMNYEHNDMIIGEGAKAIVHEMEKIMGSGNA